MKKQMKTKALVLSLAMAAMLALPTMASAQESRSNFGGLFGTNPTAKTANEEKGMMGGNGTRGAVTGNPINNEAFGDNTTPIGGGVFILLAAGLGYAAMKRKED